MTTDLQRNNPLTSYFRQPAIHIRLPSQGRYYPDGTIDLPVTGEIPVYPMTVRDELVLKTPDSLMNGSGIVEVINSCCPNILNPWATPSVDLETLFIAIKIASYGTGMELKSKCPHCNHEQENTINLTSLLDLIPEDRYNQHLEIKKLKFHFRPPTFQEVNEASKISYHQTKLVEQLLDANISDDEKKQLFQENFSKLTDMNLETIANGVSSIQTPDGERVTNLEFIREFLQNADRKTYTKIKDHINELVEYHKVKPMKFVCEECEKDYTSEIIFDQASFFA